MGQQGLDPAGSRSRYIIDDTPLTMAPPSQLMTSPPNLTKGRLPIRVELKGLGASEMYRILTEPDTNMIRQQQAGYSSRTKLMDNLLHLHAPHDVQELLLDSEDVDTVF